MEKIALKKTPYNSVYPKCWTSANWKDRSGSEMFMGTKGDHSAGKVMTRLFYRFLTDFLLKWEIPDVQQLIKAGVQSLSKILELQKSLLEKQQPLAKGRVTLLSPWLAWTLLGSETQSCAECLSKMQMSCLQLFYIYDCITVRLLRALILWLPHLLFHY